MSRADFLKGYAKTILGRDLTEEEAKKVSLEESRKKVQALCAEFAQKPKVKKSKAKKPKDEPMDESIKAVVNSDEV